MAGSSRRRSPPPICSAIRGGGGAHRGRSTAPVDLPPPPPRHYCGVRQREWGTWVAEITNRNIGHRIWLGTFQSARQAAWAHDVENVRLHGSVCGELKFSLGCDDEVPKLPPPPPSRGRAARAAREDCEAWERLEAEATGEAYMAELRRLNPERVAAEARKYEEYAAKRHAASSSFAAAPSSLAVPSSSFAAAPSSVIIDLDGDSDSDSFVERWLDSLDD